MVKGITSIAPLPSAETLTRLSSLLRSLGFEEGRGWDDGAGRGAAFLAPLGNLELVAGRPPAVPLLLVETTQLDAVRTTVRQWMAADARTEEVAAKMSEVEETHWNSRMFTAELAEGLRVGFWESSNPLHGRPVAVEGDLSAAGKRFAIVVARWNAVITDRLLQGALDGLYRSGAAKADVEIVRVPGAWEIPSAARTLAETRRFDAVITLGVLLRGETAHYEAIYTEVARGIGQALHRAGLKAGNKGFEAAIAAIEMASIQNKLEARLAEPAAAGAGR